MEAAAANPQASRLKQFLDAFPLVQFVLAGAIGLVATWTTIQLTQNSQAAEIRRNSERLERLEKESVPRELFDERTLRMIDEQKEIKDLLKKISDKK